ncbi:3-deoxy-D-manno-octulosonic acid transferase [Marinomonas pollencensis]|uniref:3-deoxy-D-manno-octulosonic acid transferase n=1 Tax=Marinomonas pollencensis TaxID=491954 RepID=A0A3E0DTV5_9GAMM|nr:3-deoxy-D-manno-octulosonic acid transferase [Marinomonas pollencensis]REG86999.1 3-deoxy-D-manno-octulosonic-acid transferase [Marinomonas pollencensis]
MWLYRLLLLLLTPLILVKVRRFRKNYPAYRAREAFGFWQPVKAGLWLHCSSVGEVLAVRPLVAQWLEKYPDKPILITTMTPTGAEQVAATFPFAIHRYLPMDWRGAVKRALKQLECEHLLIVETELWPNLLQQAKRKGLRINIVNARLSERSFKQYQRFPRLSKRLMSLPDRFLAHAQADAERFEALGASGVLVTGSIKFDLSVPDAVAEQNWHRQMSSSFVWTAGSTHNGEDESLLKAHQALLEKYPDALLILVPRHPERFQSVYQLAAEYFSKVALRSEVEPKDWYAYNVVIGDSMGELMHYYQAADLAFVGGSLVKRGGHNPIEPALLARATLVGPYTFNFADITELLIKHHGAIRCKNGEHLQEVVISLAGKHSQCHRLGQAALRFAQQNQGAVTRVLAEIDFR